MNSFLNPTTQSFVLLTLVVLQEHAYALPQPWPIVIDGLLEVAENPDWIKRRRPRGIAGQLAKAGAGALMDNKKKEGKQPDPPASAAKAPEPPQETRAPEPQKQEEPPKPPPTSQAKKAENSGNKGDDKPDSPGGLGGGLTAGITLLAVGAAVLILFWIWKRFCEKQTEADAKGEDSDSEEE